MAPWVFLLCCSLRVPLDDFLGVPLDVALASTMGKSPREFPNGGPWRVS